MKDKRARPVIDLNDLKGWLETAHPLVEALSERLALRYHLALAGSVLHKGSSNKDLDLIVYPASTADQDVEFVYEALKATGFVRTHTVDVVHARWRRIGTTDMKHVEVWQHEGRRVDFIFLPGLNKSADETSDKRSETETT